MFKFFRTRRSAPIARDRLKVLLAHERAFIGKPDLIGVLREEILAVIRKHVAVDPDKVRIKADRADKVSTLTVDIEIPMDLPKAAAA
jgi:cell division topological specificity factor